MRGPVVAGFLKVHELMLTRKRKVPLSFCKRGLSKKLEGSLKSLKSQMQIKKGWWINFLFFMVLNHSLCQELVHAKMETFRFFERETSFYSVQSYFKLIDSRQINKSS